MMQPTDSNPIELDLIALADGELDAAGMRRVEAYVRQCEQQAKQSAKLSVKESADKAVPDAASPPSSASSHPDLAPIRAMLLKQHIHQTLQASTPAVPASLEDQITQMLSLPAHSSTPAPLKLTDAPPQTAQSPVKTAPAGSSSRSPSPWRLVTRWSPAAIAAMLLVGVLLTQAWQPAQPSGPQVAGGVAGDTNQSPSVFNELTPKTGDTRNNPAVLTTSPQAPVAYAQLSSDRINAFGQRHSMCSKKLERLYRSSEFPLEVAKMPEAIAGRLGSKEPQGSLDLSQSGYQFSKAGECRVPGQPSVHLVYRTKTSDDSISLWVVTYNGKPQLAEGTLYQGDPANSDHPIFFFRKDDLVYYLVGNAFDHTRVAAQKLVFASK